MGILSGSFRRRSIRSAFCWRLAAVGRTSAWVSLQEDWLIRRAGLSDEVACQTVVSKSEGDRRSIEFIEEMGEGSHFDCDEEREDPSLYDGSEAGIRVGQFFAVPPEPILMPRSSDVTAVSRVGKPGDAKTQDGMRWDRADLSHRTAVAKIPRLRIGLALPGSVLDRLARRIRLLHYSHRTEEAYTS